MKRWELFAILILVIVIAGVAARLATQGAATEDIEGAAGPPAPTEHVSGPITPTSDASATPDTPGAQDRPPPAEMRDAMYEGEFVSEEQGFRFRIPKGWEKAEQTAEGWEIALVAKGGAKPARITAQVNPWSLTAHELVYKSLQEGPTILRKFGIVHQPRVGGMDDSYVYHYVISWQDGNVPREAAQVCAVRNGKSYVLSLSGKSGAVEEHAEALEHLVLSWKFLEPKEDDSESQKEFLERMKDEARKFEPEREGER